MKYARHRVFGHVRKKFEKDDYWTVDQVVCAVKRALEPSKVVRCTPDMFKKYKLAVNELYRNITAILKFLKFEISSASPGVVSCCVSPELAAVARELRCEYDGFVVDGKCAVDLLETRIEIQQTPLANPKKVTSIFEKAHLYVPVELQDDNAYAIPPAEELVQARENKTALKAKERR
ncbi:hypothetical protein PybrP1_004883 [[Pythium] brassicae (nom. inval.)]|nr:hypothetical protein PybrP1_004883 [[Pythium] brassicae (nom. inval.)]